MAGVDANGFDAKSLLDIQDEMSTSIRAAISPSLNLSETSLLGQYVGVTASQIAQLWEAAQDVYAGSDIDQASGDRLTALCRETGTVRRAATASTVLMDITLDTGTYAIGTLTVHVLGDPTIVFANDAEITSGAPDTVFTDVPFTCTELGANRAEAGSLTVIANPVTGFDDATNPLAATLGTEIELDFDLRLRQAQELARAGSHTVDAIRVDLADVTGVTFASVLENDTDATVDGIPPHSIEALVLGGADQDIWDALLAAKPAGIQAYGDEVGTATDAQDNEHDVAFTRPDAVNIEMSITLTALTGQYAGDDAVRDAIVEWVETQLGVGKDVLHAKAVSLVVGVAGVVDVTLTVGPLSGALAAVTFPIDPRDYAAIATAATDIAVSSTLITGAP